MLFFIPIYKDKLHENTQAEICPKIKNKLRTITRLKFWSEKFEKFIWSLYTDRDVHENKTCQNLVWSSGAGRVISKLVTFADAVCWQFQVFSLDETIVKIFLSATLHVSGSGQLIHCLKISGNKNRNLRTIWGWNCQKIENSLASAENYWFLL